MKLLDWMKRQKLTDATLAAALGDGATALSVKKWKYGETLPRPADIVRLEEITAGGVALRDFVPPRPPLRPIARHAQGASP
jgi:hypothetical protein